MALFMESTLELSTTKPVIELPLADFFISSTALSILSFDLPVMITFEPDLTKAIAIALPIPLVPPVITAVFPSNHCDGDKLTI